jgi:hypothetical protein
LNLKDDPGLTGRAGEPTLKATGCYASPGLRPKGMSRLLEAASSGTIRTTPVDHHWVSCVLFFSVYRKSQ